MVAVAHQANRATLGGFGRDMADAQAARAAAEAPIGDQRRAAAQLGDALDHAGQGQHLAHPRPAARPLVADHDHVAGADAAVDRPRLAAASSLSNTRAGPRKVISCWSTAPTLTTAPSGARLPKSDAERRRARNAGWRSGGCSRDCCSRRLAQVLAQRLPGDGQGVQVEHARLLAPVRPGSPGRRRPRGHPGCATAAGRPTRATPSPGAARGRTRR